MPIKRMLIDASHAEEMRVVIADEKQIHEFDFVTSTKKQVKGNIYLGKITRVEPSLQAAFVEYGGGKQGFLPFGEIHPDYYQIPTADRARLMREAEDESSVADDAPAMDQPAADFASEVPHVEVPAEGDTALPPLADIPEFTPPPALSEPVEMPPQDAPETKPMLAFSDSELVAANTVENEALAEQLSPAPDMPETQAEENVETLVNEEEELTRRPRQRNFSRRYKIQEVIKRGQIVLIQVIKEERGNKGVSLTTYLSLAGRYCVLMPNSPRDGGVSRKISDGETRRRLKDLMSELSLAQGMSVIIRTAGIDRPRAEIKRDFEYLVKLWNRIRDVTLASTAPSLIYEESDLVKRAIRDLYTSDIEEVLVEGEATFEAARDFMKLLLPSHTPNVKLYQGATPLFYAYNVEEQLISMHDPMVKLKSGGYIVLSPTEALISIDVNSGRSTGERNIEETATKTNLEAANEIARQLRLRDLAGLIVIDFIDMMESRNRRNVERALRDALKNDRAKIQLGRISPFGLLEMSRQRLRPSIAETTHMSCPHCAGRGQMRSPESMCIQILRSLEKEAATGNWQAFKVMVPENVALHLLNTKRDALSGVESRYGVGIAIVIDHSLVADVFNLEKQRKNRGNDHRRDRRPQTEALSARGDLSFTEDLDANMEAAPAFEENEVPVQNGDEQPRPEGGNSGRRRGRRGGRNRNRDRGDRGDRGDRPPRNFDDAPAAEGATPDDVALNGEDQGPREGRRDRGRRGGRGRGGERRRWREDRPENGEAPPQSETPPAPLPAFTNQPAIEVVNHNQTPRPQAAAPAVPPSTQRPQDQPPRRGWWQRIIELD